jgi:hypothetical protein
VIVWVHGHIGQDTVPARSEQRSVKAATPAVLDAIMVETLERWAGYGITHVRIHGVQKMKTELLAQKARR